MDEILENLDDFSQFNIFNIFNNFNQFTIFNDLNNVEPEQEPEQEPEIQEPENENENENENTDVNPTLFDIKYKNPENNKFRCEICNKEYKYFSGLYTHKRSHDPNYKKKYSCSLCNSSFDNITHTRKHIETHTRKGEIANPVENKRKLYRKDLKYKPVINQDNGENEFICSICNKKYNYRQSLQVHLKSHNILYVYKYNCMLCDFATDHSGEFKRHNARCVF